jgi:hypothetical protein
MTRRTKSEIDGTYSAAAHSTAIGDPRKLFHDGPKRLMAGVGTDFALLAASPEPAAGERHSPAAPVGPSLGTPGRAAASRGRCARTAEAPYL